MSLATLDCGPAPQTYAGGRQCPACRTRLRAGNPGPFCTPCREREQTRQLDAGETPDGATPGTDARARERARCTMAAIQARRRVLRTLLPASTVELRARRPDLWGEAANENGHRTRMLIRDLRALGAVPDRSECDAEAVWSVGRPA